mmetsp:Transcript_39155/g.90209  ORF Transcript_39155/g.90209 Transcript_39155/m.90209 type:complete len:341 (+) Transcript_39155:181-1203(+)|eukprot:CAMPEP_0182601086 /NCGR_PEP_ID=MMETSP1324-20130603/91307_1 /TAXON_ID=236786 /ORGANISM="Florenciella sp., Strain RCC1587" /LENGTH=340 /DNA_ID=CAMNT_0024818995 /DNA_START=185 /DNA_END=1207 /DNA_ORIENTATION=+
MPIIYAGVETGGTTWVTSIAVGSPSNITERGEFETTSPEEVIPRVVEWLKQHKFDALGICSFGPIDVHEDSDTYGFITTVPDTKKAWRNADVLNKIKSLLELPDSFPIGWDTDVNAPALAEYDSDDAISSCAYVTVGTGVGVGLVIGGHPVHGLLHGEGGHISVPRYPGDDYPGAKNLNCENFDELESMCCSSALAARANCTVSQLKDLPDDHKVWDIAAHYLACMCVNFILAASPEKIVLSGGVMLRKCLFPMIRAKTQLYLNTYINVPTITTEAIDKVIVPSEHGNKAGIVGALFLGKIALDEKNKGSLARAAAPQIMSHALVALAAVALYSVLTRKK